jgi:hypothetical protein
MAQNIVHSIMNVQSGNFRFLEPHDVQLVRLGALAERYFHDDPNTCLIKLRQFAELLAQLIAAKTGLYEAGDESQADLLRRLRFERGFAAASCRPLSHPAHTRQQCGPWGGRDTQ